MPVDTIKRGNRNLAFLCPCVNNTGNNTELYQPCLIMAKISIQMLKFYPNNFEMV